MSEQLRSDTALHGAVSVVPANQTTSCCGCWC